MNESSSASETLTLSHIETWFCVFYELELLNLVFLGVWPVWTCLSICPLTRSNLYKLFFSVGKDASKGWWQGEAGKNTNNDPHLSPLQHNWTKHPPAHICHLLCSAGGREVRTLQDEGIELQGRLSIPPTWLLIIWSQRDPEFLEHQLDRVRYVCVSFHTPSTADSCCRESRHADKH